MIQRAQKVLLTFNMDKKHSRLSLNLWYTGGQFHQHFTQSFYMKESQKHKETDSLIVFFALAARKRLVKLTLGLFLKSREEKIKKHFLYQRKNTPTQICYHEIVDCNNFI